MLLMRPFVLQRLLSSPTDAPALEPVPYIAIPFVRDSTEVLDMPELEEEVEMTLASSVILFNDEWHTFEEVIDQIIKATSCSTSKAESLTLEVHYKGKAMVFEGAFEECLKVSSILEEILLRTQIQC